MSSDSLKRSVAKSLSNLSLFPTVIISVVIEYWVKVVAQEIDADELEPPPTDIKRVTDHTIGSGPHSTVYHAKYMGIPVAVKLIRDSVFVPSEEQIAKERDIMTRLDHASLCCLHGFNLKRKPAYIVMEFAEGGSLYAILSNKTNYPRLPWKSRLSIILDISYGLAYLHAVGIFHRDLKSVNVLLRSDWSAIIADFGISRLKPRVESVATSGIGTFGWMAPEMLDSKKSSMITSAIDIYSFGMIMYEMLTRRTPFEIEGMSAAEILIAVSSGGRPVIPPELTETCPLGYIELMKECWNQTPSKRPTAEGVVKRVEAMLKAVQEGPQREQQPLQLGLWSRFVISLFPTIKKMTYWESRPTHSWTFKYPTTIIPHPREPLLFLCSQSSSLLSLTFNGTQIDNKFPIDFSPHRFDLDENGNFYLIHESYVTILNFKKEIILSWELAWELSYTPQDLKVDQNMIYFTFENYHQIYVYSKEGKPIKIFGTEESSASQGSFYLPAGLTIDGKYLEICDCVNHRIQIVEKNSGTFVSTWGSTGTAEGQFLWPYSIYLSLEIEGEREDGIVYIGDAMSVQLFTREGYFIQRLGDKVQGSGETQFRCVSGICVCNEQLYVSDWGNNRVQVFRKFKRKS